MLRPDATHKKNLGKVGKTLYPDFIQITKRGGWNKRGGWDFVEKTNA